MWSIQSGKIVLKKIATVTKCYMPIFISVITYWLVQIIRPVSKVHENEKDCKCLETAPFSSKCNSFASHHLNKYLANKLPSNFGNCEKCQIASIHLLQMSEVSQSAKIETARNSFSKCQKQNAKMGSFLATVFWDLKTIF